MSGEPNWRLAAEIDHVETRARLGDGLLIQTGKGVDVRNVLADGKRAHNVIRSLVTEVLD